MVPDLESLKADIKALRGKVAANMFSEEDLRLLWDQGCRDLADLKVVPREELQNIGLEEVLIDYLKPETDGKPGCSPFPCVTSRGMCTTLLSAGNTSSMLGQLTWETCSLHVCALLCSVD